MVFSYGVRGPAIELHSPPVQLDSTITPVHSSQCSDLIAKERWGRKRVSLQRGWDALRQDIPKGVTVSQIPSRDPLTQMLVAEQLRALGCVVP